MQTKNIPFLKYVFLGTHRPKPSCYFEGERRGNRRPDSLSGCQKLSNELLQAPVSVIWVFMYYLMLPRDIFSTWKPRWHLQEPAIARLKAFDILRENPASDFPVFHLRSSKMVLADVPHDIWEHLPHREQLWTSLLTSSFLTSLASSRCRPVLRS